MDSVEDIFNSLTDEQKRRALDLRTPEEILAFAKEEGYELSDDQLEAVAGGSWVAPQCPSDKSCPDLYCGNLGSWGHPGMPIREAVPGAPFGYTPSGEASGLVSSLREREVGIPCAGEEMDALARRIVADGVDAAHSMAQDGSVGTEELLDYCMGLRGEPWEQAPARRDMRERARIWRMLARGDTHVPTSSEELMELWSQATAGEFPIYREASVPQFRKSGIPFSRTGVPFEQGEPAPGKETLSPKHIEGAVREMLSFANGSDLALEERAAVVKFSLAYIHPFRDGNGHVGRMLMCRMLVPAYAPITLLSFIAVLQGRRTDVSQAIADTVRA